MITTYEDIISFGKQNVEAVVQSGTLAAKGFEELSKVLAAYNGHSIERAATAARALAAAKSPAEFLQLQAQLTREGTESLIAETRKIAEIFTTVMTSALEPLQARVSATTDLYKVAA